MQQSFQQCQKQDHHVYTLDSEDEWQFSCQCFYKTNDHVKTYFIIIQSYLPGRTTSNFVLILGQWTPGLGMRAHLSSNFPIDSFSSMWQATSTLSEVAPGPVYRVNFNLYLILNWDSALLSIRSPCMKYLGSNETLQMHAGKCMHVVESNK